MLTLSLSLLLNAAGFAQSNKNDKKPKNNKPAKSIPIDGGISLLIAAGLGVGAGKLLLGKKTQDN